MSRTKKGNSFYFDLRNKMRDKLITKNTSNRTKRVYLRGTDNFISFLKKYKIKNDVIDVELIQKYADDLMSSPKGYSASTIHSYLAPICAYATIDMGEIRKPRRTANRITKGRIKDERSQGERELDMERFQRLIKFQKAVGIRRNELKNLQTNDLITKNGKYFVVVRRGKGGKMQQQMILDKDVALVKSIFYEKDNLFDDNESFTDNVFSQKEMTNKIDLHALRRVHSKDFYNFFDEKFKELIKKNDLKKLEILKNNMRAELLETFKNAHSEMMIKKPNSFEKKLKKFKFDMDDRPYILRGANLQKAKGLGLNTEYNRLLLMYTSVFALSHWRLDVTVTNYIIS